jgi:hypothetical protein
MKDTVATTVNTDASPVGNPIFSSARVTGARTKARVMAIAVGASRSAPATLAVTAAISTRIMAHSG